MSTFALILSVTLLSMPDEGQPMSEADMHDLSLTLAALEVSTHERCRIEGERLMATLGPRVVSAEYDCVKVPTGTDY